MVSSTATTPEAYLASLPEDRREAIAVVRDTINANLPRRLSSRGCRTGCSAGRCRWTASPDTYNGEPLGLAALASQKGHMSLYLNNVYGDPDDRALVPGAVGSDADGSWTWVSRASASDPSTTCRSR